MQRTARLPQEHLFLLSGIVLSDAMLPGWLVGASQVLWWQQGAQSRDDKVCSVWRCQALGTELCCSQPARGAACGLASGSSTFLSLVSEHDESKPQVSLLSERDITSIFLLQDLLISFPHLSLLSYSKDKSPFVIKSYLTCLLNSPTKLKVQQSPNIALACI